MSSLYHILYLKPAVDLVDMTEEYEDLAQKLFNSGFMRIDTDTCRNFIIHTDPEIKDPIIFSKKELEDQALVPRTKSKIQQLYNKKYPNDSKKVNSVLTLLKRNIAKNVDVNKDVAIRLARLLVQSAHPIVIMWLLLEEVEVFISYSHSIGDMMDIQNWQKSGMNSGMQSTDGKNVAVFVSCGGDPFLPNNERHPEYGDGWAAAARLQIIAGQELGHYADIKRNYSGQQIGRHSANFSGTKAEEKVRIGRLRDIQGCKEYENIFVKCGIQNIITKENIIKLLKYNKIGGLKLLFTKCTYAISRKVFLYKLIFRHKMGFIKLYQNEEYIGIMLNALVRDMLFNLAPKADVYKRNNKEEEEAIACIEALARVPQQAMKWGHLTTQAFMHDLYEVYYSQVIPSLIEAYEHLTGSKFKRRTNKVKLGFFERRRLLKSLDLVHFEEVRNIPN